MSDILHPEWTDRFSAYLDGELPSGERQAVEAHVVACPACRGVLDDLRRIVAAAPSYEGTPPDRDLWPGISEAMDRGRAVRFPPGPAAVRGVRRFATAHLVAAAALFAVLGGGAVWLALESRGASRESPELVGAAPEVTPGVLPARATEAYDAAVADLERILAEGRARLDSSTVRVLEENLALIDRAIAETWAVVLADPANGHLQQRIAANMRRKVEILRRAAGAVEGTEL